MIKKLRMKLILASMLSLFVVLLVIMGSISILNYQKLVANADSVLSLLTENDGDFPDMSGPEDGKYRGEKFHKKPPFSPELPYASRYFSVWLDSDGNVISVNTGKIAAVGTSDAIEYAQAVWEKGKARGFMDIYRYVVYTSGEEIHIIFLDCSRDLSTFVTFVLTGVGTSAVGLLLVLLLLVLLSARIVKPFSENYEKQKRFITDAGHELKTPLTIIDADAEVLEMDFGKNEWLNDIRFQTERLANLTNSLILLSRMDEGQPASQMIEFPLSDVTEETTQTFQALAKTQDKTLTSSIEPMVSMCGDENAIRRLIALLLDNAVKYSDPQGKISLSLEKQKNSVRLCVYNTAQHVSQESLGHLFDRFYRADQSRNSQTGGYGLGLSIALAIVSAHRGKITAATRDEKSLQITVVFPLS